MHVTLRLHNAFLIHQAQIFGLHMLERFAEWVDPEMIRLDWISNSDVATSAFVVVAILAQPSDTCCRVEFPEGSLVQRVLECGYPDLLDWICLSAGDWMRTINEAIERLVSDRILQLLVSLLASKLVNGSGDGFYRRGCHCDRLEGLEVNEKDSEMKRQRQFNKK
jgi:hypothetical protein